MIFPDTIETARLTLRRPLPSDAGPITLYVGDSRVANMLTSVPHPYPPGAAENFIERSLADTGREHVWSIDATKIGAAEFVGVISLKRRGEAVELGYWVGFPFWNTGYASEAAQGVVVAAAEAGCRIVEAEVVAGNEASAHVLQHAGLAECGAGETFGVAANRMLPVRRFALTLTPDIAAAPART